jgi:ATP-dependent DNA helicase UvrD/PcrA
MSTLLEQLNPQQRQAVENTEGPMLILAGAGSGKTRVITFRIAHLIQACRIPPESLLAVTFTNKAAAQMKDRVSQLLAELGEHSDAYPHISTFHSFCVRVLRHDIDRLGYSRDFSIYDDDDQLRVVKACINELGLGEAVTSPRAILSQISYSKNRGLPPEEIYKQAYDPARERLAMVFERYNARLKQSNALDFDDLLTKTVELLYSVPEVCEWYNQRFRYILVDEYQDTNHAQYELIRQLTLARQNLCVVGDEDQSIYRWRGADISNILSFEKDYPQARIFRLEQNYRSTQLILDAASAVVSHNAARKGKSLWTERGAGEKIVLFAATDADEEARFVTGHISSQLASRPNESIAVLYRTNSQSRVLEEAMRRASIAYRMVGGFSFYARAEIRNALAYARLAANQRDDASFLRIVNTPARGIGESTIETLAHAAKASHLCLWQQLENSLSPQVFAPRALRALQGFHDLILELVADKERLPLGEFFKNLLERTHYLAVLEAENDPESESRIENLRELVNAATEAAAQGETLVPFLDHAALVSDADQYDERARVTLMTLHSAKGLEFHTVFLVGLEEGLFPHNLSRDDEQGIEEERRLCYVGMTRARDRLLLSWAGSRRSYGRESFEGTRPSRFLEEIPQELLDTVNSGYFSARPRTSWDNAVNSVGAVERFLQSRRLNSGSRGGTESSILGRSTSDGRWRIGSKVRHAKYGVGTIIELEGEREDTKLTISFPGYGLKKMVERMAALEKI